MVSPQRPPHTGQAFLSGMFLGISVAILGIMVVQVFFGPVLSRSLASTEEQVISTVHERLVDGYVNPPNGSDLMRAAVRGMVESFDDRYCSYLGPEEQLSYTEGSTGKLIGIGVQIARGGTIHYPRPGGPAEKAGLLPGDRIIAVDGRDIADDMALNELTPLIKGPKDSTVHLQVQRGVDQPEFFEADVKRTPLPTGTVAKVRMVDPAAGIGHIHIRSFAGTTAKELDAALDTLMAQGMKSLILDLRFNRGGLLDSAVDCAGRFLNGGVVCTLEGRNQERSVRKADPDHSKVPDLPVVILINGLSASGSEVLAGALRDRGKAILVGQQSYGKGVYQQVLNFTDGKFTIKYTAGYYLTPSGRVIESSIHPEFPGHLNPDLMTPLPQGDNLGKLLAYLQYDDPPEVYREKVFEIFEGLRELSIPPTDPTMETAVEALRSAAATS